MAAPTNAPEPHVITAPGGAGDSPHWSTTLEGSAYGVEVSYIHLSTTRVDVGPPLHQHPYPEIILIRQGRAMFTLGSERFVAVAGQTLVIPPDTPHTFRTLGGGRYESLALHQSPEFVSEILEADGGTA
ncbi:AraC family ligand binding domain-containing protein [Actinomycetospora endophytica]|uniref:AraC family ligand binding domain-containing protein n=1 Tax=Actinomycetospora endophytica TaxID=2291215 RepID=A0ABS8P136_9PSEU|nr:AraC family ligand binding domain-containing protein [Actinomycetospora endophytica]MCD2191957.1 AraC family ligand binding domain-containing protein [Actinomycetospora endophytica]